MAVRGWEPAPGTRTRIDRGAGGLEVSRRQGEAPNRCTYPGASQQALEELAQADSAMSPSVSGGA